MPTTSITFTFKSPEVMNPWLKKHGLIEFLPVDVQTGTNRRNQAVIEKTARDVAIWWPHLGEKSKEFWIRAAQYSIDNESFTFEKLATNKISVGSLKSRHRNSYRAIKHAKDNDNAEEPLYQEWSWEIQKNIYVLAPEIRDRILELHEGDRQKEEG